MDDRDHELNHDELCAWVQRKRGIGKIPLLLGLFNRSDELTLVTAVTIRHNESQQSAQRAICMIGVAPETVSECTHKQQKMIRCLAEVIRAMCLWFGYPSQFETMRPKTMTWTPMQTLHDAMKEGLTVRLPQQPNELVQAQVTREHDRDHALY